MLNSTGSKTCIRSLYYFNWGHVREPPAKGLLGLANSFAEQTAKKVKWRNSFWLIQADGGANIRVVTFNS